MLLKDCFVGCMPPEWAENILIKSEKISFDKKGKNLKISSKSKIYLVVKHLVKLLENKDYKFGLKLNLIYG